MGESSDPASSSLPNSTPEHQASVPSRPWSVLWLAPDPGELSSSWQSRLQEAMASDANGWHLLVEAPEQLVDLLGKHSVQACLLALEVAGASPEVAEHLKTAGLSQVWMLNLRSPQSGAGFVFCYLRPEAVRRLKPLMLALDPGLHEVRLPDEQHLERHRKLLNRLHEGFVDFGADLQIVAANTTFKRLVGDSAAEGKALYDYFDPVDRPRVRAMLLEQQHGIILSFSARLAPAPGCDEPGAVVSLDPAPRRGPGGQYWGGTALVRAASETNSHPEALREQRELFTLFSISSALATGSDVSSLHTILADTLQSLMGADAVCTVITHEGYETSLCTVGPDQTTLPPDVLLDIPHWGERIPASRPTLVVRDTTRQTDPMARLLAQAGFLSVAGVRLATSHRTLGCLWVLCRDSRIMHRDWVSLLISIGQQYTLALDNSLHIAARLEEEKKRKTFYREAVYGITNGKLHLLERPEMEALPLGTALGRQKVSDPAHIRACRDMTHELLTRRDFPSDRVFDVTTCVSEAATNALRHGGGGVLEVFGGARPGDERLRLRIEDHGKGINFSELPRAVLKRGHSTAVSMGLGFTMMLELMDTVYLTTDAAGTILVMELAPTQVDLTLDEWLERFKE